MKHFLLAIIGGMIVVWLVDARAVECTPYADCRYTGEPARSAAGEIVRDWRVIAAYKKLHPCPSTGLHTGACVGWKLNHTCPLACGCADAVWNLSWMRNDVKLIVDGYERKISASIPPQPDTANCVNIIIR